MTILAPVTPVSVSCTP
ncbi:MULTISPECIES: hypothetical protein [Pseudomonas]